ncbi:MAG: hypothetical protein NUV46_02885 [Nanoarchaeota archaeon]|nr:hypothetical protein [Nanoarchaeota archaeon]
MFKKITLLLKKDCEIEAKAFEEVHKTFIDSIVKIISFDNLKKEDLLDSDLVITIGGDGTFVKAGNLIEDSLIIGINSNPQTSEGALTEINIDELQKLSEISKGNFEILKRDRARVRLNGMVIDEHAINEVYVGAFSQFHSSRYIIKFNDNEEEHRSSGVIVSTATGSPAWFYSAGGEKFNHSEEKLSFIVREPYYGERIFVPKILKGDLHRGERLILKSKRDSGGILAINEATYPFNEGDIVEIELSEKPLKVVKLK